MINAALLAVRRHLFGSSWNPLARAAWCRSQRRRLRVPGSSVVWVRAESVAWAEWGASHGYFEVQQMDGISYLRALGAPIV